MNIRKAGIDFWNWLFKYSLHVSSIAILGLAIIDISNINEWTISAFGVSELALGRIIYFLIVAIALVFGIFSISNSSDINNLENKNNENDLKISDLETTLNEVVSETNELFNSYLKLLSNNLGFTHNERISVYKVYENEFVMIGRTSESPNLKRVGRTKYPLNEGFIGKGWDEGEFFISDLPEPEQRGGSTYYNAITAHVSIDKDIVDSLKMKSRTYYVYRMDGFNNEPKALIVAESKLENAFTEQDIQDKLEGVSQPLVMFIEKINPLANTLDDIEKMGL